VALKFAVDVGLAEVSNLEKLSFLAVEAEADVHLAADGVAEQLDEPVVVEVLYRMLRLLQNVYQECSNHLVQLQVGNIFDLRLKI
jgi:hypothetical protein